MAFYADITTQVEATIPQAKITPLQFLFSGPDLDIGEGTLGISSIAKKDGATYVLPSTMPQANISVPISTIIGKTYAGITGEQILAALGELADSLYQSQA